MARIVKSRRAYWLVLPVLISPWLGITSGQTLSEAPELRSAAAVRALTPEQAQRRLPVRLLGVVTYHEPWASLTFVQDDSAGIYVALDRRVRSLRAGDWVEIIGVTSPGRFAPSVVGFGPVHTSPTNSVEFHVLGEAPLPVPYVLSGEELNNPANDCQWVQVRGKVKQVTPEKLPLAEVPRAVLRLDVEGQNLLVIIPEIGGPGDLPDHLVGARVRVTGTFGTFSNERRQLTGRFLYAQTLAQVVVEESADMNAENLPLSSATSLLQFSGAGVSRRVRVQGTVLWQKPREGLYLRSDGTGLFVQTAQMSKVQRGEVVEAIGYATPAPAKPFIQDAVFRVVGTNLPPVPRTLKPGQFLLEDQHADLVEVEVELLVRQTGPEDLVMGLRFGATLLEARMDAREALKLPDLRPGSRLRITGIGQANFLPTAASRSQGTLSLLIRDAADVTVLATPPWLTIQRAGLILAVLAVVCSLAALWIFVLRRRVEHQTVIIRGHVTREAVHEERARIARDFHDTVQQQLAGIAMELQTAELNLDQSPTATRSSLTLARQMIRHSLAEVRQTIWDLRSPALERGGLVPALEELIGSLRKQDGAELKLQVLGPARRLAGGVEQGLLRIAQEALGNALKHGHARHCSVTLEFGPKDVRLTVSDDGQGFDRAELSAHGELHFGLLGMQERANKLGARFDLRSQPGQGTCVEIQLPTNGGSP